MRRPPAAREALSFGPLIKAGGADASAIECVPCVPAGARPEVIFARRPTTERASNARAGRLAALVKGGFVVDDSSV